MFQNLRDMWQQASSGARLALVAGALLILAIVVYFGVSVLRPEYQTLFADLDPQDAATMVSELDKMKVPYRLGADGTSIQVDKSQVHALRLKLLGKSGTLRGGVGFKIFK
jgi:flagellar M-ring protein FliF